MGVIHKLRKEGGLRNREYTRGFWFYLRGVLIGIDRFFFSVFIVLI